MGTCCQDMAIILQELTANTPPKKARDLMGTICRLLPLRVMLELSWYLLGAFKFMDVKNESNCKRFLFCK